AFYECIRRDDATLSSFTGKLNGLHELPAPQNNIDNYIAACISFCFVGQNLVGSEYKFDEWRTAFVDSLRQQSDMALVNNSIAYGRLIADSIVAWTKKDNYLISRGLPRFSLSNKAGTWQPTPEDYSHAIEPHWNT